MKVVTSYINTDESCEIDQIEVPESKLPMTFTINNRERIIILHDAFEKASIPAESALAKYGRYTLTVSANDAYLALTAAEGAAPADKKFLRDVQQALFGRGGGPMH